jgi:hypothetical protein
VIQWDRYAEARRLFSNMTIMKMGVEGWERRVLAGRWEMLSRSDSPVLQVEFADDAARAAGSSYRALYECWNLSATAGMFTTRIALA